MSKLPEPTKCDSCDSANIIMTENSILYGGKCYGKWHYCWYCLDCNAAVGCHPNTRNPLGFMANKETRQLRSRVHKIFDKRWRFKKNKRKAREAAYIWLANLMTIKMDDCHISQFDKDRCLVALKRLERRG